MSPFPLTIRFTRKFPPYGGNHEGIRFIDILDHPRSFELDDDDSYDDVINLFKAKEVYRDGDGWNIRVRFVVPSSDEEWEWGMRVADRVQDGKMRPYSKRKLAIKLEETFRRAWANPGDVRLSADGEIRTEEHTEPCPAPERLLLMQLYKDKFLGRQRWRLILVKE